MVATLYKGDQVGLFDPEFAQCTFIDRESIHLLEVAIICISQFSARVCDWLMKKAAQRRRIEKLFMEANQMAKAGTNGLNVIVQG